MSIVQADLYPSRQHNHPRWQDRLDPIAWRKDAPDSPLTEQQLSRFERDGFLVIENLFSAEEVAVFKAELQRMSKDPKVLEAPTAIREPDSGALRSVFAIHRDNPLFARVARDERTAGLVRHLLDGDIYVHQSRLNLKPGFKGKEFYWHSDFETWHIEDGMPLPRALSISVSLTDNTPHNGPLLVMPGSHKHYVVCEGETPPDNYQMSLQAQEVGVPSDENLAWLANDGGLVDTAGPAGSVLIFDCNLMHGSNSNITHLPRSNAFFVYNALSNAVQAPFCNQPPRPEFIATRDEITPLVVRRNTADDFRPA